MYERKETAKKLLGQHGQPKFIKKMEQAYISAVKKKIHLNQCKYTELENLQQEFIYYGVIAIVKRWLLNDAKESPEEIEEVISKCMTIPSIEILESFV
ncbi:TetR-like C-terminal domain-containing protein [Enterococcus sp. DIV1420a]|uniref:TetR-like C-terminal domain-containing protein n=1 Tax=Enterococcus sp. DIV1420a TaxID=2774672 RepID=UPI003F68380F